MFNVVFGAAGLLLCTQSQLPATRFEQDTGGWVSIAGAGKVSVTHDVVFGKSTGSMLYEYTVAKGAMDALILPLAEGSLAKMRSVSFSLRSDYNTTIGVVLEEKEGGRYIALVAAKKDTWQMATLTPQDFILSDGPNDPKDPNGMLDLDKVAGIGLSDFKQFIAQADEGLITLFGVQTGAHKLYVGPFVAAETAVEMPKPPAGAKLLDAFGRGYVSWLCVGNGSVQVSASNPVRSNALQMDYSVSPKTLAGIFRAIPAGLLASSKELSFQCAATIPTKIVFQLEERGGGKYNTVIELAGGSAAKEVTLAYSTFQEAQDSRDDNGKLDLAEVKQVLLLDISGLLEAKEQTNTLWVGPIAIR